MSTLEDLFVAGLARQSDAVAEPDFAALEGVVLGGARRARRRRATVNAALTVAAAAVVAGAAWATLHTPAPVAEQPTPLPTATSAALKLDPLMPQAPTISDAQWQTVDGSWDVELAVLNNPGGQTQSLAVYLTPPGGSRLAAYADQSVALQDLMLLGFDAANRSAYVFSPQGPVLATLDLRSGSLTPTQIMLDGQTVTWGQNLGQTADGHSVFYLELVDDSNAFSYHVFELDGQSATEAFSSEQMPVAMLNGAVLTGGAPGFTIHPLDGSAPREVPAPGCDFTSWAYDGTITAFCGYTGDGAGGQTFHIDPVTGAQTVVPTAEDVWQPIDAHRAWNTYVDGSFNFGPPVIDNGDGTTTDLSEGFLLVPAKYSAIFGVRP